MQKEAKILQPFYLPPEERADKVEVFYKNDCISESLPVYNINHQRVTKLVLKVFSGKLKS
jgi:hypothetical protein